MKHYLYRWIRLDKNEPFYIGVGTKTPDDIKYGIYSRSLKEKKNNSIWKSIKEKSNYEVEILLESDNYEYLLDKEKEFIKLYGRIDKKTGILANMTDGGEGTKNVLVSEKSRKLRSLFQIGKKKSKESIEKRTRTLKERGYKHSEKTINKIKASKAISVFQYDLKGNLIKSWNSIQEAALSNKLKSYIITNSANTKNLKSYTGGNFIWLYKHDIESKNLFKFKEAVKRAEKGQIKKNITKDQKSQILADFKSLNKKDMKKGEKIQHLSDKYQINYSTIRQIIKNQI